MIAKEKLYNKTLHESLCTNEFVDQCSVSAPFNNVIMHYVEEAFLCIPSSELRKLRSTSDLRRSVAETLLCRSKCERPQRYIGQF